MKIVYSLLILLLPVSIARAQHYFYNENYYDPPVLLEAGIGLGGMNCLTDLGGRYQKARPFLYDLHWGATHPGVSFFASATFHYQWALRFEIQSGTLSAADSMSADAGAAGKTRFKRNLHFKTAIQEALLLLEIHPLAIFSGGEPTRISPYLTIGIGRFHFSPEAQLNGRWYALHDYRTEGQGFEGNRFSKSYSLQQWNVPLGMGLGCDLFARGYLRLEFLYRFLYTDYLDDVSNRYVGEEEFYRWMDPEKARIAIQLADRSIGNGTLSSQGSRRGNTKKNDGYFHLQLKFGWVLNRERR